MDVIERVSYILGNGATAQEKKQQVRSLSSQIGALPPMALIDVRDALVDGGWSKADAKEFIAACKKTVPVFVVGRADTYPYLEENGRICLQNERQRGNGEIGMINQVVCDFTARIVEEGVTEEGVRSYTVEGVAVRGGKFVVDIDADKFSDARQLKALLESAAGPLDGVAAKMEAHLAPAIRKFSESGYKQTHRFNRTGWSSDGFLIPGREKEGMSIRLPRKLCYHVEQGDIDKGIEAMDALCQFMNPIGTLLLSHMLLAPLAAVAGWQDERTGLFIKGRTGKGKTSSSQVAMCLYGKDFIHDQNLIKWGIGSTSNAMIGLSSTTNDLPILFDNYKPGIGAGKDALVTVTHMFLEGGDRERLDRSGRVRESKPINAWMVATGEDFPSDEASTAARLLVPTMPTNGDLAHLTRAQELSPNLEAVGWAWIEWLESREGQEVIKKVGEEFRLNRDQWRDVLTADGRKPTNPNRTATNLSTNWLTWLVLCEHPVLGEFASRWLESHSQALQQLAVEMSTISQESLEAARFLAALEECIDSGRVLLLQGKAAVISNQSQQEKDRIIGWQDGEEMYLFPDVTLTLLEKTVGLDLNGMTINTLYAQLNEMGALFGTGEAGHFTKKVRLGDKTVRVLCVKKL